mgnify:FL=1|jgi:hypothetical protein|tara:strand:- start:44200 stop:44370 length:171 start_codon:yes stop_codon:yes gene_type:complete
MDAQELLIAGKARVVMDPIERGTDSYAVVLKINGEYFGEFPTYTAAANHIEMLVNE